MKEIYASSVKLDGRKGLSGTNRRKKWVDRAYSAAAKWNAEFGRVEIEGSPEAKTNFYSSLYRLFIQPNNIADAVEMIRKMACSGISRFASGSMRLQNRSGASQGVQPPHRHVNA